MHDYDSPAMAMGSSATNVVRQPEAPVLPQLFQAANVIEKRLEDLRQRLEPITRPLPPRAVSSQKEDVPGSALPGLLFQLRAIESQIAALTETLVL